MTLPMAVELMAATKVSGPCKASQFDRFVEVGFHKSLRYGKIPAELKILVSAVRFRPRPPVTIPLKSTCLRRLSK